MRAFASGAFACAACAVSAACISLDEPPNEGSFANQDAAVTLEVGAPADAATEAGPVPPPKPPCDPSAVPPASAVFVSTSGDDLLGGTAAAPVKTIGKALALAKAQAASDVIVEQGVYAEEVTIASATIVHGGWKATGARWTKDCSDGVVSVTVIRSTTARAVTVSGFAGTAGLDTLTIATKGQAAASESAIAIFVSGTSLTMSGVDVASAIGGDGVTPPTPTPAGNRACGGYSCESGLPGGVVAPGNPAAPGRFDATGWINALGTAGQGGVQGQNGVIGSAGQSQDGCVQGCGAAPTCAAGAIGTAQAGTGLCGCGGLGGAPGAPGTTGGASVGVFVAGPGKVSIAHSNVTSSRGGNGAAGASGGVGGVGTTGSIGVASFCAGACSFDSQNNTCLFIGGGLAGGGPGGRGGQGSPGGQGGGGAGGPSYALVTVSGATAAVEPTVALRPGEGGAGAGGASAGEATATIRLP